jgi:crotonobetainyl-CoA:carnitine CoA-transferase CaiB-like acyl-CoA transferase
MKSWSERLNDPRPHQVKPVPADIAGMKKGEVMLIPTAKIVDSFIRTIGKGRSMDVPTLRATLARRYKAQVTCPITTGFRLRTVAEAAWEAHQNGTPLSRITPFWRVLDEKAPTTAKLSFGAAVVKARRAAEGLPA